MAMSLAGWSDAAYGAQEAEGKSRLGYVVGLTSSTLSAPRRILRWASKFARKLAKSSLGGEVYTSCDRVDHMSPLREFNEPSANFPPGMLGLEDCESLFKNLGRKDAITAEYRGIQQSLGNWGLERAYWLPGLDTPAGGLTQVKCEMVPPLRLLESGALNPGILPPLIGIFSAPCNFRPPAI